MKLSGILMMGLLVFAFTGLQDVRANEADEAFATGEKYYNGDGVTQDYAEAKKWFLKAADQGHAEAQFNIAGMYLNGKGVTQNYTEAKIWFLKAAEQGFQPARDAFQKISR